MKQPKLTFLLLILFSIVTIQLHSQIKTEYFDGPYIFQKNDSLLIQWVERGIGHDSLIAKSDATVFQKDSLPFVNLQDLDFKVGKKSTFRDVEKLVAISDVHGQYPILIQLLKSNGVIDESNNWMFGKGHLVITGDNMDRGNQVLEILWFLFHLQKAAAEEGGKVHVLLGNHERMILQGDIRYLSKKYYYTSGVLRKQYQKLFHKGSILGDWIASHKVLTSINQRLFVHGGLSPEVLKLGYSIEEINKIFTKKILRKKDDKILSKKELKILDGQNGPLWYRGYFDSLAMNNSKVDMILKKSKQKTIIVGHTSQDSIQSLFDGKIIAIDCSIKYGKTGQALVLENEKLFVGNLDGSRKLIGIWKLEKRKSVFDFLYSMKGRPVMKISTDMRQLIRRKSKEEYQPVSIEVENNSDEELFSISGRIRARGNVRKKVCKYPPVKIDFEKSALDSLGFLKVDKLKMVFPCQVSKSNQQFLLKEFFLYELYNLIDTNCIRTKLVDIQFMKNGKMDKKVIGFIIEDEEEYARRNNARIIENAKISASRLDREPFLKVLFFQYMIANTDWSVGNKHNLELVKFPDRAKVCMIPYDFDYSGFVGQDYATPHSSLPIEDVHQRYFFSYKITEEEFYRMVKYYKSIEEEVYELCESAKYMNKRTRKENKKYLKSFFTLLKYPKQLKRDVFRE